MYNLPFLYIFFSLKRKQENDLVWLFIYFQFGCVGYEPMVLSGGALPAEKFHELTLLLKNYQVQKCSGTLYPVVWADLKLSLSISSYQARANNCCDRQDALIWLEILNELKFMFNLSSLIWSIEFERGSNSNRI